MATEPSERIKFDCEGGKDVWAFVNEIRRRTNAINHGQGFPNWSTPDFVKRNAQNAITNDHNQYAPNTGLLSLTTVLAERYTKLYQNKYKLTPQNVQTTNGCAGALDSTFRAFLNKGDEVIAIEPFFTFYRTQAHQSGAKIVTVSLDLINDTDNNMKWKLDINKLKNAITNKSRILILNSPQNPTGLVISLQEMNEIAEIVRNNPRILVVTDEVYENISSEPINYFASIAPDMFKRTIVCCSAAKSFSVTGWKIGWCIGPKQLIKYINFACRGHCWSVNTPCQQGMADSIIEAQKPYMGFANYYAWLNDMYSKKRVKMLDAIKGSGMKAIAPQGAYYIMVDASEYIDILKKMGKFVPLNLKDPTTFDDWQFVKWLMEEIGVAVIPGSAFYDYNKFNGNSKFPFIRFAYCTSDETIEKTAQKLRLIPKMLRNRSKL